VSLLGAFRFTASKNTENIRKLSREIHIAAGIIVQANIDVDYNYLSSSKGCQVLQKGTGDKVNTLRVV